MNKIFAILKKELLLKFSSPLEWLYFLILPIFFTLVLAGGTGSGSADMRIRLLVTDQAQSPLSSELIAALENSSAVYPELTDLRSGEKAMKSQSASSLLVIPETFTNQQIEQGNVTLELREQPNNLNALAAYQAVTEAVARIENVSLIAKVSTNATRSVHTFTSDEEAAAFQQNVALAASTKLESAPQRLNVIEGNTPDEIPYDPQANSSAGQMITWVFIPLFGLSVTFSDERQRGTLRRILTTPISKATYLFGIIFSNVLFALGQMVLLVLFGIFVMKLNWGHAPGALAVMLVCSTLAAAAIGTALGTVVKSEAQANGLSIMLGMVMALLGGCWYPLELFPAAVQNVVKILPTRWAMQGMLDILVRGQGISGVLPEAGVLLAFALVFFVLGIWRFKYE